MFKQSDSKLNKLRPILDNGQKVYIETYGCQMNVNDSEVVLSILQKDGFSLTENMGEADVILINTCSIRDNAEKKIWGRLKMFQAEKKTRKHILVGLIGCMAGRLKEDLLENRTVDIVVGPDSYRDLPILLKTATDGQKGINVLLSREETYSDISPVRLDKNGVTAFISIMRGCNKVCSYCVVPFTRGVERSRNPESIIREAKELYENGYKEITLLGQNVDSYLWNDNPKKSIDFARLLEKVALAVPKMRIRFSTSYPNDMSNAVLYTIGMYENICSYIHLPVQSGSNRILEKMRRKYTREEYLERVKKIREVVPNCAISTDIIVGFCSETEEDHKDTLSLMREVGYDLAYMFKYSERPDTKAARLYNDDVSEEDKSRRLDDVIALQAELSAKSIKIELGRTVEVLIEGVSKKSDEEYSGRTPQNKVVVFPKENYNIGDFVKVKITDCTPATLIGIAVKQVNK